MLSPPQVRVTLRLSRCIRRVGFKRYRDWGVRRDGPAPRNPAAILELGGRNIASASQSSSGQSRAKVCRFRPSEHGAFLLWVQLQTGELADEVADELAGEVAGSTCDRGSFGSRSTARQPRRRQSLSVVDAHRRDRDFVGYGQYPRPTGGMIGMAIIASVTCSEPSCGNT
jgi:hypothetical protein